MNLVFFDPTSWDYDTETPREVGLGGSQSSACYLAEELATRGHMVSFVNGITERRLSRGVLFLGRDMAETDDIIKGCDALIVLNLAMGKSLREAGVKVPMVLWMQHDADQEAAKPLRRIEERSTWNKIVVVSRYQQTRYAALLDTTASETEVIGNAIAPAFLEQPIRDPWFITGSPTVLAYTSTPFRGLDRLLEYWPEIRRGIPGARLRIFSSMAVYRGDDAPYRALYEIARTMEGVDYIGSIGQRLLARGVSECALLAYPCSFHETYCISAAEAVAVGCTPVVPPIGALPETLGPAGIYAGGDYPKAIINVLRHQLERREVSLRLRRQSIDRFRAECTWRHRAVEWETMLSVMLAL